MIDHHVLKAHQQVNLEEESIQQVFCALTKNTPSVPLWWLRITYNTHLFIRNDVCLKINNYTLDRDFKRGQLPVV